MIVVLGIFLPLLFYLLIRSWTCHAIVLSLTFSVTLNAQLGMSLNGIVICKLILLVLVTLSQPLMRRSIPLASVAKKMFVPSVLLIIGILPGFLKAPQEFVSMDDYLVALFLAVSPLTGYFIGLLTTRQKDFEGGLFKIFVLLSPSIIVLVWGAAQGLDRLVVGSIAVGGLYGHLVFLIIFMSPISNFKKTICGVITFVDIMFGGSRRYILPVAVIFGCLLFVRAGGGRRWIFEAVIRIVGVAFIILAALLLNVLFSLGSDLDYRGLGYRIVQNQIFFGYMKSVNQWLFGLHAGFSDWVHYSYRWSTEFGPRIHSYYYSVILNFGLWGLFFTIGPICLLFFRSINHSNLPIVLFTFGWIVSAQFDTPPDGMWVFGWAAAICQNRKISGGMTR